MGINNHPEFNNNPVQAALLKAANNDLDIFLSTVYHQMTAVGHLLICPAIFNNIAGQYHRKDDGVNESMKAFMDSAALRALTETCVVGLQLNTLDDGETMSLHVDDGEPFGVKVNLSKEDQYAVEVHLRDEEERLAATFSVVIPPDVDQARGLNVNLLVWDHEGIQMDFKEPEYALLLVDYPLD